MKTSKIKTYGDLPPGTLFGDSWIWFGVDPSKPEMGLELSLWAELGMPDHYVRVRLKSFFGYNTDGLFPLELFRGRD